ncbi:MAG: class I SAM-dependent methyltransferase, partial [Desulfovibrionaceae bacterium]|nr:class I SAM-dependent methyltransferase [Desulfovibrionaceae bacterium]
MKNKIQSIEEIERWYSEEDPWHYDQSSNDEMRKINFLSVLPKNITYERVLDIGCGNGFMTVDLPGEVIIGCDISCNAINYAKKRAEKLNRTNITFKNMSIFDCSPENLGGFFDLIVINDVLYSQYIGDSISLVHLIVDNILKDCGYLAVSHISNMKITHFP